MASSGWHDALAAVPGPERALAMANSLIAMLNHLPDIGLDDRIAYVELRGFWGMVLTSNAAPHHPMWHIRGPGRFTGWTCWPETFWLWRI